MTRKAGGKAKAEQQEQNPEGVESKRLQERAFDLGVRHCSTASNVAAGRHLAGVAAPGSSSGGRAAGVRWAAPQWQE